MYCKAIGKEVDIAPSSEIKDDTGNIVKVYSDCTYSCVDLLGIKVHKPCYKRRDQRCLLNK